MGNAALATCGMKISDVNDVLNKLIPMYEAHYTDAPAGKTFQECYDVKTVKPTQEYLEVYDKAVATLRDIGGTSDSTSSTDFGNRLNHKEPARGVRPSGTNRHGFLLFSSPVAGSQQPISS